MQPAKLAAVAVLVACLPLGHWAVYAGRTPAPQVIEGDGVRGPTGMVWVPAGDFLIRGGSSSAMSTTA